MDNLLDEQLHEKLSKVRGMNKRTLLLKVPLRVFKVLNITKNILVPSDSIVNSQQIIVKKIEDVEMLPPTYMGIDVEVVPDDDMPVELFKLYKEVT